MKKLICFSIILLCYQPIHSQSIQLFVNGGLTSHFANTGSERQSYQHTVPSIGVFYSSAPIIGTSALFYLNDMRTKSSSFFAGVLYEHSSLPSETTGNVLGDDLIINTLGLSAGYKFREEEINPELYLIASLKYLKKFYSGHNNFGSGITSISTYTNETAFGLSLGLEYFAPEILPFIAGITMSMDFGSVRRDVIEFYQDDEYKAELEPTGDLVLPDNVFNVMLNISYLFSL